MKHNGRSTANTFQTRMRVNFWLVLALTFVAVFLLPLFVPVRYTAINSASYLVGFNNRAAAAAVVLIGALVFLVAWRRSSFAPVAIVEEAASIRWTLLLGVLVPTWFLVGVSAWLVRVSHLRYLSDAGYFIEQMAAHQDSGRALYSQLDFAYGPLLFYPTIWLQGLLRCSWTTVYFVSLALNQTLGVVLLALLLNGLPMRRWERRYGFCLFALGAFTPLLGLNYTLLRFVSPFALLLVATRRTSKGWTGAWFLVGEAILLGISPEQAFAFAAATATYAAVCGTWRVRLWLALLVAGQVAEAAVFSHLAGPGYLSFFHLSRLGALNLPVAPYPHLLVFLFAAVWLVPSTFGGFFRSDDRGKLLGAQYALALALVPAALGRCDPLHIFFEGLGLLALSLVAISGQSARMRTAWMTAALALVCWEQAVNQRVYLRRTVDTFRVAVMPRLSPSAQHAVLVAARWNAPLQARLTPSMRVEDSQYRLDVPALERTVGRSILATPLEVSPRVEEALKRSGHYKTDHFAFLFNVLDPVAEARKIAALDTAEWALLPRVLEPGFLETPSDLQNLQGFNFPYPVRHEVPYYPRFALYRHLATEWKKVCAVGPYTLYVHHPPGNDDLALVGACL